MKLLSIPELATVAGVSRQAMQKAALKIFSGKTISWRGSQLDVHEVEGRGGRSGISYAVTLESLPNIFKNVGGSFTGQLKAI